MSVPHIILSSWLPVCQKLSNLVEIWRSSDKNKLGHFLAHPVHVSKQTMAASCVQLENYSQAA